MKEIKAFQMDDGTLIAGEQMALRYKLEAIMCRGTTVSYRDQTLARDMVNALVEKDSEVVSILQRLRKLNPTVSPRVEKTSK